MIKKLMLIVFWTYGFVGSIVLVGSVFYNFFVSPIDITWVLGVSGPFSLSVAIGCIIIITIALRNIKKLEDQYEKEQ